MGVVEGLIAAFGLLGEVDVGLFNPGITPNDDAVPGIPALRRLLGGVLSFCLFASIGAVIVAFLMWAWGRMSGSTHRVDTGKTAAGWALVSFIGFGMVNTITSWAWGIGQGIPLPGAE
ncbi:hypothetical protein [Phytoactinopolyspora limicola]|uniref:hypothetical protein n=1 Tax=Phytoactinopolyspora limicola TaxID=2715536 RepID=UPI00140E5A41|nr:hypothetical protein [Phytoactinopolyspora limicola]